MKNQYPGDILITFIGRLIDGKGLSDLMNAVKKLNSNFRLFIVGDGPQKNELENLAKKLGFREKIIFFGHKKFEEAMGILKISDIFVNPSYTEGLPTSVIEAAFCKKAIIATNVGGTPEIITDNQSGYLINPKDIPTLKNKLEILINNETLRKELGNNAYNEMLNKFNWNKSIERYLEIFDKMLK